MRPFYSFLFILSITILSCKKDHDAMVTGTVIEKSGCYTDTYLVAIENPDPSRHKFLRPTTLACAACYNCSNAVFLHLSPALSAAGTRVRFSYIGKEISCLSSSEAPEHVKAKNISKL